MQRKGVSGVTHNQPFESRMTINPRAVTALSLVSCGRDAALRLRPGAYTMPNNSPMDFLPGAREELIRTLV